MFDHILDIYVFLCYCKVIEYLNTSNEIINTAKFAEFIIV